MHSTSYSEYLAPCNALAREAGRLIMTYFNAAHNARKKADHSPVTDADIAANTLIVNGLKKIAPHITIVAEEDEEAAASGHETFWLVDPLDGTRSFVRGEPEFTVNIGLIHKHKTVLGVIYAPPQQLLYYGLAGQGAFREAEGAKPERIQVRPPASDGLVVVRSRSQPSAVAAAFLKSIAVKDMLPSSSSLKFCVVAEGAADIYPRFGRTMEWDTAAGQAILEAAGGRMETADGRPFLYGKPGYENPHFIAYGG
ncbi:MAG: 3'(2'),5'-bisphosphate nucleotidase [Proteobacteria bacterium]|nr:3'(2'),5'-bisphosphate nucleotidase [Pseudomonadota bacterium]